jgi:V/A-type H+-transporting ATPase subunit E
MDTKIQELTDKIYREGVEKGQEEANRIISEANQEKQTIVNEAEEEAKRIISAAKKQAAELEKNTKAELKLYAAQAVEALKSEVANLVAGKIASSNVAAAAFDKEYMRKVILAIASEWAENETLTIRTSGGEELGQYFAANAKDLLNKGVAIEKTAGKDTSFTIVPADGSYKVVFGEDEFVSFFKDFLRPQLVELLFRDE